MKQPSLTNVRQYIEWIVEFTKYLEESQQKGHSKIAPIYAEELPKIRLIGKAILRKHPKTKVNRKDIYVESK